MRWWGLWILVNKRSREVCHCYDFSLQIGWSVYPIIKICSNCYRVFVKCSTAAAAIPPSSIAIDGQPTIWGWLWIQISRAVYVVMRLIVYDNQYVAYATNVSDYILAICPCPIKMCTCSIRIYLVHDIDGWTARINHLLRSATTASVHHLANDLAGGLGTEYHFHLCITLHSIHLLSM